MRKIPLIDLFRREPAPAGTPAAAPAQALPAEAALDRYLGVPLETRRPNAAFLRPYRPDRAGLRLRFAGARFSPEQPASLWYAREAPGRPAWLQSRADLAPGDLLTVADDLPWDFSVGTLFARVRREGEARDGFITLETLTGETFAADDALWTAQNVAGLRAVAEISCAGMPLFAPNRLLREKAYAGIEKLSGVTYDRNHPDREQHPLGLAAEAQRVAIWALAPERTAEDRARASAALDSVMKNYFLPAKRMVAPGVAAWPYPFDFSMPWGTRLPSPWYSGYANAAVASAAACAWKLSGDPAFRDTAREAAAFLRLPIAQGGALYEADGYLHIAEYVYRTPPLPNYRVLDGEIIALVFLYDAALLLEDAELLHFAMQLGAGLAVALDLFCADDGLPVFGMDGQRMNPDYMWQLWAALQMLANIFKERAFSRHAAVWRSGIPAQCVTDGFPV